MFEVKFEGFSGPMEKLLALIEERQLEITRVNLAAVTADFITYIEGLGEKVEPGLLSDFVVVAARLLVIKSKVLVPALPLTEEEEGDIVDLEHRLMLYREFKKAGQHLQSLWQQQRVAYPKPFLSSLGDSSRERSSVFYPPPDLSNEMLFNSFRALSTVLSGLVLETKTVKQAVVTLQEKIQELTSRLSQAAHVTLRGKVSNKEKSEVIVMFLAVLHMLSGRLAHAEQEGTFGDIIIKKQEPSSTIHE